MLDAIMEAHRLNQELIAHAARAAREGRPAAAGAPRGRRPTRSSRQLHDRYARRPPRGQEDPASSRSGTPPSRSCRSGSSPRSRPEAPPAGADGPTPLQVKSAFYALQERVVREMILDGYRPDGRGPKDLRPISCEVAVLPSDPRLGHLPARRDPGAGHHRARHRRRRAAGRRHHGGVLARSSSSTTTCRSFAVGEVRPIRGPGRREIGHGMLAERSVAPILPDPQRFPYTIRVISRHPRVQRLQLDGLGLRRHAQPDGRRRADHRPGRRHLDRPGRGPRSPAATSS